MQADGYLYVDHATLPSNWDELVADATAATDEELTKARFRALLEPINSARLQLKFPRTFEALPTAIQKVVAVLHDQWVAACGDELKHYVIQDCYALYTPTDEVHPEARAPQRWHLDAIKQFPVAALLLRGARSTEFAAGPYSDFAAGVSARKLDEWTASLKHINARTWESESNEEWEHFNRHLHAAELVTADEECDWSELKVATSPEASPGSASIFWSNKVHRGPGTDVGEERLVLFCSWLPSRSGSSSGASSSESAAKSGTRKKESETDYSYYDGHMEPKLRLSARALRSNKRHRVG